MIEDQLSAVPDAHRETARSALSAVFGSVPVGAITPIAGGATGASVFRVEVGNRRYLLREVEAVTRWQVSAVRLTLADFASVMPIRFN